MKKHYLALLLLIFAIPIAAQLPAFPGAEGHGRYTVGGRGGTVYRVTSLEDTNTPGTLRYAINQNGARTIVFDVAGTIHLKSELRISRDYITIAGQTAPGQGICIADYGFVIAANQVIIRYVRFRPGNKSAIEEDKEPDGLGGMDKKNIIIDHCSVSWSVDECLSVYGCENLTVQWSIISESLRNSGHSKGAHGYGGNWGGNKATYHHNLMAHHASRVPRLGPRASTQENEYMDLRNNVFYNWAGNGCYGGEGMKINIVNNYYKPGPATSNSQVRYRIAKIGIRTSSYVATYPSFKPMEHVWGKYYVDGNVIEGNAEVTADNWTKGIYEQISNSDCDNLYTSVTKDTIRLNSPLETDVITTHTAQEAFQQIMLYAGCSLDRDIIDERIVRETKYGTATYRGSVNSNAPGLIDIPQDVMPDGATSPWPELSDRGVDPTTLVDTDGDGIPDVWEVANGLNPNDASDGKTTTLSKQGYTNLEVYLNSLVEDITNNQNGENSGSTDGDNEQSFNSYEYVTPSTLASKFDAAKSGTVLILSEGTYTDKISIPSNRMIKLKADDNVDAIINFTSEISGSSGENNGILIFEDVTIDPSNVNYFISLSNASSLKSLQFKNCNISSSKRGLMTIAGGGLNGELIIDNCIFELSECGSYSYIYNNGGATQKVSITNSTFYNYPQEHLFWTRSYGNAVDFEFTFEQNTVYRWGKSNKEYSICKIEEANYTIDSKYIFRNNIVSEPYIAGAIVSMLSTTGGGSLIAENNVRNDIEGYRGANLTYSTIKDLTIGEGILSGIADIDFSDPDSGEFFIESTSPLATASTTGGIVGDPRWLVKGTGIEDAFGWGSQVVTYTNNGTVYLKGLSGNSIVEVYTYTGSRVVSQQTSNEEVAIHLPKGNYIVKVIAQNEVSTHKVINY